ncbi:MAG: glycine zipper domain-containing protein [Candidatus Binatia bacterium]
MNRIVTLIGGTSLLIIALAFIAAGCAGGPLTTREKAAGIGTLGGAAAGGIIGSAVGHPAAGAVIGGGLGLGAGALIGDQMQGQEIQNQRQDQEIRRNQAELKRQRQELERMRRQQAEY